MMRQIRLLAAVAALGLAASGLGGAQAGDAEDITAIEAIWPVYAAAVVEGDVETWLDLWAEGGVQMPPGMPARELNVLRVVSTEEFAAEPVEDMNITPAETVVAGDWAWSLGTYNLGDFNGKFMTIFRRQSDGSWKIYRDIFSANE